MPDSPSELRPIQVFLDAKRFIDVPEVKPHPQSKTDFFAGNDRGFAEHKSRMKNRVTSMATSMRAQTQPGAFIKVRQRELALAKSHRPLGSLFTPGNRFALVGAEKIGELLFQATPVALERLAALIETKAELKPPQKLNKRTGQVEPNPSPFRTELSGIEEIQMYAPSDRVTFSANDALEWMRQPNAIGGYLVELFRPDHLIGPEAVNAMVKALRVSLEALKGGILVRPILPSTSSTDFGEPGLILSVQLIRDDRRLLELPFAENGDAATMVEASLPQHMSGVEADLSPKRHAELLQVLAEQPLVRSVDLPPILETTPASVGTNLGAFALSQPRAGVDYPTVAIIDGGVNAAALGKWCVGDAGLVPATDRNEDHGTFIAGLLSAGHAMNPSLSADMEPVGCRIFDIDLFPKRELRNAYYADLEELFDVLDEKIKVAKKEHGVRVFNLSFSLGERLSRLAYSVQADRLDRIARANDVIFVVAAGNLKANRPPWPDKANDAVVMLASFGVDNHQITSPSEHLLGLTVGAVNPVGVVGHVPQLPTTYTRRGPGVGGSRKPDLAHYGGVSAGPESGLVSLSSSGEAIHSCGTSYAAPLTASTVATLDQRLARQASRELLLTLPVHRAKRSPLLEERALQHIAREFVGFGIAPPAESILNDDPHSITLIFNETLLNKQRLEFEFAWPRSLVTPEGACRGRAEVTLGYTPPIDPAHREEAIRVQVDASLQQEKLYEKTGEVSWEGRLSSDSGKRQGASSTESYLVRTGLKWSPLKRYQVTMPLGRGNTSNWRLGLGSLVRGGSPFPVDGVSFCLVLTISDLDRKATVREEMRQHLQGRGFVLADVTLAHRVRPRSA